jgi:YVTN family beta-propeller protein
VNSQTTTHTSHPRSSRPRWWRRRGAPAAALSLALPLTAASASGLTGTPAWAAGGYRIIATIPVGNDPAGVAVSPRAARAYVTNGGSGSVSVINTATDRVIDTIAVGGYPAGVAVSPRAARAYVTNVKQHGQGVGDRHRD